MRLVLVLILVLGLAVYGVVAALTVDHRSDESRIKSVVEDAVAAANRRNLSGIMRCISPNYRDEAGLSRDRLRMLIAQAMRSEGRFTASAQVNSKIVSLDSAEISLKAVVRLSNGRLLYERDIVLALRRENARHAYVIPVQVWRIADIKYHGLDMAF